MTRQELALNRSKFYRLIREHFDAQDFIEVETPQLTPKPGMEPHLNLFATEFLGRNLPLYLNTSPELQMKKLLGAGFEKIYNITKVFRNGEFGGGRHNPEFTMIEWYRQDADYRDLMTDCEEMIGRLATEFGAKIPKPPWPRKTIHQLFLEHCNIDLLEHKQYEQLSQATEALGLSSEACTSWDDLFFKIFLNEIEPKLDCVFVYDYPASQAALAKKSASNPFWAERVELYIDGIELSNGFSELIDPIEQRARLQEEQEERAKLGKTVFPIDEEFLQALQSISKPCAGIALGLDRLLMLILGKKHIEEVLLFPFENMINN